MHSIRLGTRIIFVLVMSWFGVNSASATIQFEDSQDTLQQRKMYLDATTALKKRQYRSFNRLLRQLNDSNYVLAGYLEFEYLSKRLSRTPDKEVLEFLQKYDDSPISSRLRYSWLRQLARKRKWDTFLEHYVPGNSRWAKLACIHAEALFRTDRIDEAMRAADQLWLVGSSQPKHCEPVFQMWEKRGGMTNEMIWRRVELAIDHNRVQLAKFLAKKLPAEDREWVNRWVKMHYKPASNLHRKIFKLNKPVARKIVRHGIRRMARRDAGAAKEAWENFRDSHLVHDEADVAGVDQYIALRASYQRHPKALEWLGKLENPSQRVQEWRIRTALNQQDWWAALTWIEALPATERESDMWQYWRARILEMQSYSLPVLRTAAERIFDDLSGSRSYHGFLAADRMGRDYDMNASSLQFSEQELQALFDRKDVHRAYELYRLKDMVDARREWINIIGDMEEKELQMMSVLASRWGWHDRAILTVAKGSHYDDLDIRFPIAYRDEIVKNAEKNSIDPAWVYGILRQESVFMPDARSHAGAMGLMQIMPKTGRLTARHINTRLRNSRELLNASKNILLGTAYLKRMLDRNSGNSALATASYNAGPYRVKSWMPEESMPADLWVESIPFTETREYVRRVMAYTVIYDQRLDGQHIKMRDRMPTVKPNSQP